MQAAQGFVTILLKSTRLNTPWRQLAAVAAAPRSPRGLGGLASREALLGNDGVLRRILRQVATVRLIAYWLRFDRRKVSGLNTHIILV